MRKRKPLTPQQVKKIKETIRQLEVPVKLEDLLIEVKDFFELLSVSDCQSNVSKVMLMYLRKFVMIMEEGE